MLGKIFKISALAFLCAAVIILAAAFACIKYNAVAFQWLIVSACSAVILALICNISASFAGWQNDRYDAFIAVLSKVFKITALVLFVAAIALGVSGYICVQDMLSAGGWLLVSAWGGCGLAGLFAVVALILGKSSTAEKAGKLFLLATPFVIILAVLSILIFVGGFALYLWFYVFALFI